MYIKLALLLLITGVLSAKKSDSVALSYEFLDFKNSLQKNVGQRMTLDLQKRVDNSALSLVYERTDTKTYQPPLKDNLRVDKFYTKIVHKFKDNNYFHLGYIYIDDNIVPSDGTRVYSLGYEKALEDTLHFGVSYYYGDFNVLKTNQYVVDAKYKLFYKDISILLFAKVNKLSIKKCQSSFCQNAQQNYTFSVLKSNIFYKKYFFSTAIVIGKRVFSVMKDGFSCSHHAMEFNRTYMFGVGKRFNSFELKIGYNYLKATELPLNNSDVKIEDLLFLVRYFF